MVMANRAARVLARALTALRALRAIGTPCRWLWYGAVDTLLEPHCVFCHRPLDSAAHGDTVPAPGTAHAGDICGSCIIDSLRIGGDRCLHCGAPQGPGVGTIRSCSGCPKDFSSVHQTAAWGRYWPAPTNEPGIPAAHLRDAVLRLKFLRQMEFAPALGRLVATAVAERDWAGEVEAVVPVPLHWWRQWHRGFNQSAEIARPVATRLHVPIVAALRRIRFTPPQSRQSKPLRQQNLADAFRVVTDVTGKTMLVVDDVMTTGATLRACAKTLRKAGAKRVYAAVVARA